jgi:tetratricopeptide (TPR) repeat protein
MNPRPFPPEGSAFEPALAMARDGRLDEALVALSGLLRAGGHHGQRREAGALAFAQVAHLAEAAGDSATALRALDEALRLAPRYADLHYRRGCLLLDLQQRPAARAALERALSINPGYVATRLELALLDAREGLLGESLAALRVLGEEHRVEEPRTFQQGLKSLERADWDEAGALLKRAVRLSDPAVDRALDRHRAMMAQGEHASALNTLREAIETHPGYPDLHYLLGSCELETGLFDDALASLARALELHPDYHAARVQFARALEALGDLQQAGEQVALVLQEDPAHPQALELQARWTRRRDAGSRAAPGARKAP